MNIALYQVIEIEHFDQSNMAPNFIIWDIDERKRLSISNTYEEALECIENWKKLKNKEPKENE